MTNNDLDLLYNDVTQKVPSSEKTFLLWHINFVRQKAIAFEEISKNNTAYYTCKLTAENETITYTFNKTSFKVEVSKFDQREQHSFMVLKNSIDYSGLVSVNGNLSRLEKAPELDVSEEDAGLNFTQTQLPNPNQTQSKQKSKPKTKKSSHKSGLIIGLCSAVLVAICVIYFILMVLNPNGNNNVASYDVLIGGQKISCVGIVNDAKIISPYKTGDNAHGGIDITGSNYDVFCFSFGEVHEIIYNDQFNQSTIVIKHNDSLYTKYSSIVVNANLHVGDTVNAGAFLGTMAIGSEHSVNYLHFEIRLANNNGIDPTKFVFER